MNSTYFDTSKITGPHQKVMAPSVAQALRLFCDQEPEFEQAIEQSDKTFQDCLDYINKGIHQHISDLDAYKRAVEFYFKGADVKFNMTIDLCGSVQSTAQTEGKPTLSVSLDDLLDF